MAAPLGGRDPAVEEALFAAPYRFRFFQAVRLLERRDPSRAPVGRLARPADEAARFRAWVSLAFPPSEVMALAEAPEPGAPPALTVAFLGLTGPSAPLPEPYAELILDRLARGDRTLAAFLDVFHHRMISFFYRAWEKHRPAIAHERDGNDPLAGYLLSLIGLGIPPLQGRLARPDATLLPYAGMLSQRHRPAVMLRALLADTFGVPVAVEPFVGRWLTLEAADRTRLGTGGAHNRLGASVVVGRRSWDEQGRFRLRVGPLSLEAFRAFLPGGSALRDLAERTRLFVGPEFDFEIQLVLRAAEAPPCRLTADRREAVQLGRTAWVRSRPLARDPADLRLVPAV
jgi:type VI secretion system protein ImpH